MANRLVPCVGCSRHFRATDEACPFCGRPSADSVPSGPIPSRPEGRPLTRAAILFATAATAAGVVACGKDQADKPPVVVQPYGVPLPPPDAEPPPQTDVKPDASTPVVVQPYGVPVPPPDAGAKPKPTTSPPTAVPAYGVPPPTKH